MRSVNKEETKAKQESRKILQRLLPVINELLRKHDAKFPGEVEEVFIHYNWRKHVTNERWVKKWFGNYRGFGYFVFNVIRDKVYEFTCDECHRFFYRLSFYKISNTTIKACDCCLARYPEFAMKFEYLKTTRQITITRADITKNI